MQAKRSHSGQQRCGLAELNTQSRKAHVLRVAGAQLPVRNDVQKNLEAITLNSAVDLTAKNAKITKTYSYAWIA